MLGMNKSTRMYRCDPDENSPCPLDYAYKTCHPPTPCCDPNTHMCAKYCTKSSDCGSNQVCSLGHYCESKTEKWVEIAVAMVAGCVALCLLFAWMTQKNGNWIEDYLTCDAFCQCCGCFCNAFLSA